ncbi:hypothetical protein A0H81_06247 [Grifola frondosa]|uniref:Uncharacterized protein n=1 Tax=Grifola frondosa TaxID=5627 RepID=A0A1C7MCG9_GRIFR|nr:hypothetical protein A0H81_06247 [Grifola frondosa]
MGKSGQNIGSVGPDGKSGHVRREAASPDLIRTIQAKIGHFYPDIFAKISFQKISPILPLSGVLLHTSRAKSAAVEDFAPFIELLTILDLFELVLQPPHSFPRLSFLVKNMLVRFSLIGLIAGVALAADSTGPTPTAPGPGDKFDEGTQCSTQWTADPSGQWTTMNIELMTGDNLNMVHITTVATVDGTDASNTSFSYPCPEVTPNSAIYFYQFTSPASTDRFWTTRFAIADASGNTTPPTNATQPGGQNIPWGTGALKDPSLAVPPPSYLQGNTSSTSPTSTANTTVLTTPSSTQSSSSSSQSSTASQTSAIITTTNSASTTAGTGTGSNVQSTGSTGGTNTTTAAAGGASNTANAACRGLEVGGSLGRAAVALGIAVLTLGVVL